MDTSVWWDSGGPARRLSNGDAGLPNLGYACFTGRKLLRTSGLMGMHRRIVRHDYQYGGKVAQAPAGQLGSGVNRVSNISQDSAGLTPVIGAWQSLSRSVQAPPTTQSVGLYAGAFTFNTTPPNFDGNVDDLFIQAAPIAAVPTLDGRGLAAMILVLAAAAMFFLRR